MSHVILLPQSLVDAKGDLLVGSADNAVIRKAVGSDGQILTADSSQPGGVKWASASGNPNSPKYKYRAGGYYRTPGIAANDCDCIQGYGWANPIWIPAGQAFDRIGIVVDVAGPTGSVHRLAIYRDGGTGLPNGGARMVDGGAVASDAGGNQEATISWTCPADDVYHLIAIQQAQNGGKLRAVNPLGLTGFPDSGLALNNSFRGDTGISGAAPSTFPSISWGSDTNSPMVYVRAA